MESAANEERERLFNENVERLTELAARAVLIRGMDPERVAVVAIHVDDPDWTDLAERLMPGTDWDAFRNQGLMPIARGSVEWGTVEYICAVCPDVSGVLDRESTLGHLYAFVLAEGGVSVYEVPYTGAEA